MKRRRFGPIFPGADEETLMERSERRLFFRNRKGRLSFTGFGECSCLCQRLFSTMSLLAFVLMRAALSISLGVVVGCGPTATGNGEDDGGGANSNVNENENGNIPADAAPHVLSSITVTPVNDILEVDLETPSQQAFSAMGGFMDDTSEDVTNEVTWASSNPALGSFSGNVLEIPGLSEAGAEVTVITASLDGIEGYAQLTVMAYRMTGEKTDFFFILPYEDPDGDQDKPLEFSTDVQSLDLFFAMDTTGSMYGSISNLQSSLSDLSLEIKNQISDTWFGVGAIEDFPVDSYGSAQGADCGYGGSPLPDQPFKLRQVLTDDMVLVQSGVDSLSIGTAPIGCGADWPESHIEGLYQIATGEGLSGPGLTNVPPNNNGVGGVEFRDDTMPVVALVTDALSHAPGESTMCYTNSVDYLGEVGLVAHTRQEAKDALAQICARVVGVAAIINGYPDVCLGLNDQEDFARDTGAMVPPEAWDVPQRPANCPAGQCCTDFNGGGRNPDPDGLCPLVFKVDSNGSGLGESLVTGIEMLTRYAAFDVFTEMEGVTEGTNGEPLPASTTTADFIKEVVPDSFQKPPPPPELPDPTMDTQYFYGVTPGTIVKFNVVAYNDFVEGTEKPQIFRAVIRVLAGGCTALDEREVFILVPPNALIIE